MICYNCRKELTADNQSVEHIIINSAGGKLKGNSILCEVCNNDFGTSVDAGLSKAINPLVNFLLINRENGRPQKFIAKDKRGVEYLVDSAKSIELRSPEFKRTITGGGERINAVFRNKKEFKQFAKKISEQYGHLDCNDILSKFNVEKKKLTEPLNFQIVLGGLPIFRGVVKIAANYLAHCTSSELVQKETLDYIHGVSTTPIIWFDYSSKLHDEILDPLVYHYLQVCGVGGIVYCVIHLLGAYKYIVLLDQSYIGSNFKHEYLYDLIELEEIEIETKTTFSKSEVLEMITPSNSLPILKIQSILDEIRKIGQTRTEVEFHSRELMKLSTMVLGLNRNGVFDEETKNKLVNKIANYYIENVFKFEET